MYNARMSSSRHLPSLVASTALQVLWSSAEVKLLIEGAVPAIARGRAVPALRFVVVASLGSRQGFAGHGVLLGLSVADQCGQLSATSVDEPVGNLVWKE